jgi:xylulose-5-phosphate/fructose-6-phosphate phosphoketolase
MTDTLSSDELRRLDASWRAANYLSVGQIYLLANPLLREPLTLDHVKPRLLGHWGTTPGLNLLYAHMNRAIRARDLNAMFVTGPGHGGPGLVASTWLEGSYTEVYPDITRDEEGMRKLFRQFSFPGGIPSHVAPETPGSIHEGGELGYALVHAYGAVFDNPDLLALCVVGDGEAETGPLAASWHSNKFVNPARDGAVLPVLHLNGYKIANPTVLARIPEDELRSLLEGYGHAPRFVTGDDPEAVHQALAAELDAALDEIAEIQRAAREGGSPQRPRWPMLVLRTPKGWTGPKEVDGQPAEGTFRSHQVPLAGLAQNPEHLRQLEAWMRSYKPEELFDEAGRPRDELLAPPPAGERRMGANPHTNGGALLRDLRLPDFRDYAVDVPAPARTSSEATRVLGAYLRDVMRRNEDAANFRVFGPDETASNRLGAVLEETDRAWMAAIEPGDDHLAPDGRVMEVLSEHLCQGWLEGYLLTGRHGLFDSSPWRSQRRRSSSPARWPPGWTASAGRRPRPRRGRSLPSPRPAPRSPGSPRCAGGAPGARRWRTCARASSPPRWQRAARTGAAAARESSRRSPRRAAPRSSAGRGGCCHRARSPRSCRSSRSRSSSGATR